jgi:hypothetical protein
MEITVNSNIFRLLNKHFLVILPVKGNELHLGQKLSIHSPVYGKMGVIQCVSLYSKPLGDLKAVEMLLADGDTETMHRMREEHRMFNTDEVWCATFCFVRRFDAVFQQMIQPEAKRIGLEFSFQTPLFTS